MTGDNKAEAKVSTQLLDNSFYYNKFSVKTEFTGFSNWVTTEMQLSCDLYHQLPTLL